MELAIVSLVMERAEKVEVVQFARNAVVRPFAQNAMEVVCTLISRNKTHPL